MLESLPFEGVSGLITQPSDQLGHATIKEPAEANPGGPKICLQPVAKFELRRSRRKRRKLLMSDAQWTYTLTHSLVLSLLRNPNFATKVGSLLGSQLFADHA